MTVSPRISVVIPTHNRSRLLANCLKSIVSQAYSNYEVIVVDDGCTDDTASVVGQFSSVHMIRQNNRGPAAARNAGIQAATGDIVAFTDDDCVVPPNWLAYLCSGYKATPDVAGVGGVLSPPPETRRRNPIAKYEWFVASRLYGANQEEYVGGFECPAGGTNNMSYRRSVLLNVGGFDETFPYAAGEDADLKWRICEAGHRLLYIPVKAIHLQKYNWSGFQSQQIRHGRGSIHFENKHVTMPSRARILLRAARRTLRLFSDLITMKPEIAWIKLWAGLYECIGQWQEVHRLAKVTEEGLPTRLQDTAE